MIDYQTYCRIKTLHEQENFCAGQIARELALDPRTVRRVLATKNFQPRKTIMQRASKLDPYKELIKSWIERHGYTAVQIFQRLGEQGFHGGYTIVKDYVSVIRPRTKAAFLTLSFAPGECAQVDWGSFGNVTCGQTTRKLSFFVMVLCYSRLMYVEFTVLQTMEHFLGCHVNAFEFFGGVPKSIMVDNLKSAVLKRLSGEAPVFNPRYLDFAQCHGFRIRACGIAKGNEKGRVESGVGYVKKNFLKGLEITDFSSLAPAASRWLMETANVRIHGETKKRPLDLFPSEKSILTPLPAPPYDIGTASTVRAYSTFRVTLDTNRYSVPPQYAGQVLLMRAYPDRVCLYSGENLVARHPRSYDRNGDFEHPDHPKELILKRRRASAQKLYSRFLALSPKADEYYRHMAERRLNTQHHVQKIVALSEIYGAEAVRRALDDAFVIQAFSSEYIANICEVRATPREEPAALSLTRKHDLLELDIPEPDLSVYDNIEDDHEQN